ncbi:MAG: MMPL family transporter, partial [Pirellula sp.]
MSDSTSSSRISRCFAAIVDHPLLCYALLIAMTLLALGGYFHPSWPRELSNAIRGAKPAPIQDQAAPQRRLPSMSVERDSLGLSPAYLVVQSDQIFTREGATALRDIVDALESLDTVAGVQWIDQAPPLNIFGLTEPILPRGQASPQRFAMAKAKALRHPLIVGLFLSSDAKTLLIGIRFDWVHVDEDSDCTTHLLEKAQETLAKHPDVKMTFSVTGGIPLRIAILENQASNELTFQLIGYGMILLMAIILFRGVTVVLVVAAAPALGVFWALGYLRYFGWEDNPFSQVILPVLLSLIGFADGVHMMVYIRRCLSEGQLPKPACRSALSTVGVACSLTTITTSIGMGSLAFSKNEVVREFAYSCVLGSSTILVAVLLVIPLACCARSGRRLAKGADRGLVDRYLQRVGGPVSAMMKHSRIVAYFAIALIVVLATCTFQLRPDDRQSNALPSGSDAQKALAHLDSSMGGLAVGNVRVGWSDAVETSPTDVATVIDEIDQLLGREPLLAHPLSLCKLLAALPGDESPIDKVPMSDLLPPPLKLALYDPDNRIATITFRTKDLGTAAYKPVFERVEAGLKQIEKSHEGFFLQLNGEAVWRWRNLYKIVSDLAFSLGTASIEILFVMGVAFRSLRLGVIAIIPNMIPLAASGTFMAIFGWPLDIVSVCSFTVCLGIAVDDTIHFLSRYREEQLHQ